MTSRTGRQPRRISAPGVPPVGAFTQNPTDHLGFSGGTLNVRNRGCGDAGSAVVVGDLILLVDALSECEPYLTWRRPTQPLSTSTGSRLRAWSLSLLVAITLIQRLARRTGPRRRANRCRRCPGNHVRCTR